MTRQRERVANFLFLEALDDAVHVRVVVERDPLTLADYEDADRDYRVLHNLKNQK